MWIAFVCMVLSVIAVGTHDTMAYEDGREYAYSAETAFVCGADGVITAYSGSRDVKELTIPASISGKPVTGIGANVFKDMTALEFIAVPDTVVSIGDSAFSGCSALTTMYAYSVSGSAGDGKIVILNSEQNVYNVITLPSGIKTIGTGAFAGCKAISKFAVAETNADFTVYAWNEAAQSTEQSGEAQTVTKKLGEMLTSKDGTSVYRFAPAFHYTGTGLYSIPDTAAALLPYSFEGVSLNGGFTIPKSVKIIGDYAFYKCGNLNNIEFADVSQTSTIGAYAFAGNDNLRVVLPESVTSIGTYSFAYCSNIQIDISKTKLTVIPDYAFYECNNLHELSTPVTLKTVGAYVFYGCDNLNEVKFLGTTLDAIGTGAFQTCQNLHKIDIPEGVTTIADSTFDGCQNLNTIILPDSLKNIGDNAFKDCKNIHEMVIPANVTHISNTSFAGANQNDIDTSKNQYSQKFIKAELPKKDVEFVVGNYKYKITKSSEKNGTVAVYGLNVKKKSVKAVSIPSAVMYKGYKFKVTSISTAAFKGCTKLTKVKLGANVTTIGGKAFANCVNLKKIVIPSKVSKIGGKAFYGCKRLKSVTIKSKKLTAKRVGKSAFTKIYSKAVVKVPKSKSSAYKKILKKSGIGKKVKIKATK